MARVAAATGTGNASAGAKTVAAAVFVVVMALVVLVLVRARPSPEPFDPRSGQPSGARGLVLTLQESGADVTDTGDVPSTDDAGRTRVVILDDRLDDDQRARVLDFAAAGGVVVVADPQSTLHGGDETGGVSRESDPSRFRRDAAAEANVPLGECDIEPLTALRGVFVPDGVLFPIEAGQARCFTDASGAHAFAIVREFGDGAIVGLGDNESFINEYLRFADNAGVMVSLLVPERGAEVTFLTGRGTSARVEEVGSGDESLRDLVPAWVWMSLVLGAVAFVVFAISRSSRVGRIVDEPIAAPIAGSELVVATGNLMERAGHSSHAGWLLLERLHRDLCRAHGVDLDAPLVELDRAVANRSGTAEGEIEALLRSTVPSGPGLLQLTAAIDRVRLQVFGTHDAASPAEPDADSDRISDPDSDPLHERVTTP